VTRTLNEETVRTTRGKIYPGPWAAYAACALALLLATAVHRAKSGTAIAQRHGPVETIDHGPHGKKDLPNRTRTSAKGRLRRWLT
jgi:hypothetical protein